MSIYESFEEYAELTKMTLEQAKTRCSHFLELEKQIKATRKCPECSQYTLAYEAGEWESGLSGWIYCENDKIETKDDDGDVVYEECDFTDALHDNYLFAFEPDFDVILCFASQIQDCGLENVEREIGLNWNDFIESNSVLSV